MEIPYQTLSPEALRGLMEEFITREGTEYGMVTYELEAKVAQVLAQIEKGRAKIVYDEETESCTLVLANKNHELTAQNLHFRSTSLDLLTRY